MTPDRRPAAAFIALALSAVLTAAPQPARADGTPSFIPYLGYVKDGYDFFEKYIKGQPDAIAQMQAMINQAKTAIISELDGLAAAWDSSCAANAVDTFQNIDQLTPDNLQAFAISSDKCVTDAQTLIAAVTDKAAMDKIGFALNTVGPIALIANAHAGFPTNALQQHIISANQDLKARLTPSCDVSIDDPNSLPGFGEGAVTGHGACYNFHHSEPARIAVGERGGVFYLQQGPNTAFLSWPMRGDAVPDDDLIPWRGYTVGFPVVDFSIAVRDVMQGTSWQVADTALNALDPAVARIGPPVTLTVSAGMQAFRTDSSGNLTGAVLKPYPDPSKPLFFGWYQLDGWLQSVAAAANSDGRVEIFGISKIGTVFHRWQQLAGNDSSWSPWAEIDKQFNCITVARNQDGTLQIFGTDPSGNVWASNQILGGDQFASVRSNPPAPATDSWTSLKQMDGSLSQVAAVTDANGFIHLFGINPAGNLFHRRQAVQNATDPSVGGAWTAWDQVQGPGSLRMIAVTVDSAGHINIFGITAGGGPIAHLAAGGTTVGAFNGDHIFQRVKLDGETTYTAWSQIPGSIHSIASANEGGAAGKLVLIGIDANGNIHLNTSDAILQSTPAGPVPDSWNGWEPLPNTLSGAAPGLAVPSVTGMKLAKATGTLLSAGLGMPFQHYVIDANCNEPAGTVIKQNPGAGTQVAAGFIVQLDVETWPTGRTRCN